MVPEVTAVVIWHIGSERAIRMIVEYDIASCDLKVLGYFNIG